MLLFLSLDLLLLDLGQPLVVFRGQFLHRGGVHLGLLAHGESRDRLVLRCAATAQGSVSLVDCRCPLFGLLMGWRLDQRTPVLELQALLGLVQLLGELGLHHALPDGGQLLLGLVDRARSHRSLGLPVRGGEVHGRDVVLAAGALLEVGHVVHYQQVLVLRLPRRELVVLWYVQVEVPLGYVLLALVVDELEVDVLALSMSSGVTLWLDLPITRGLLNHLDLQRAREPRSLSLLSSHFFIKPSSIFVSKHKRIFFNSIVIRQIIGVDVHVLGVK